MIYSFFFLFLFKININYDTIIMVIIMSMSKKIIIFIYVFIVLIATFIMFTFTSFSNSTIGSITIIGLDKNIGNYDKGSLLIATKSNIQKNDNILFYDIIGGKSVLKQDKVKKIINTNKNETTYVIDDNKFISSDYVISNTQNIYLVPLFGYVYLFLANKYVYFLTIILPIFLYFLYQFRKKKDA